MAGEMIKVAVLQNQMQSMEKTLNEVRGHQDSQTLVRNSQYTEIVTKLATMSENMNNYQNQCTADRKEYNDRITENRSDIGLINTNIAAFKGQAAGVSIVTSGLMGALAVAVAWFHK